MTVKNEHGLTPQQEAFAGAVATGASQSEAYRRAYPGSRAWRSESVRVKSSELASRPVVRARINALMSSISEETEVSSKNVIRRMHDLEDADARELCEIRRNCCRYCWGAGFRYQRTAGERERAYQAWLAMPEKQRAKLGQVQFDEAGGIGFHKHSTPNPDCPECFGDGEIEVFFKDTRGLSRKAVALFAGVKITEKGMEIKMRDQDGALNGLARVTGAYEKDNRQNSDPLAQILRQLSGNVFAPRPDAGLPRERQGEDDDG